MRAGRAGWLVLALLASLAACGDDPGGASPDAGVTPTAFLGSPFGTSAGHIRDELGRAVILRGVNARLAGVFDVTFEDPERTPVEDVPPLAAEDCTRLHELGFDFLRLPISWSGLEPTQGQFSEAYLLELDATVECMSHAGVYVLIDFHQDAFSKEIGEDGAPLWAIVPTPERLLEGPLTDRRTDPQVIKAFESFFAIGDPHGLQAEFIDALAHVATRYADHPGVVGFEIFNEPVTGPDELYPFTFAAAARLRAAAPKKLVFFEPPSFRNQTDFQPLSSAPFPVPGSVYAPHIYTGTGDTFTIDDLEPSMNNARAEADAWATPLYIGEFGNGPDDYGRKFLGFQYDLQDRFGASSSQWLWKENVQSSWGFFDHVAASDTWVERPQMIESCARPHAQRVAGTPTDMAWDPAAGTLTVAFKAAVAAPHVIAVPGAYHVTSATCDGAAVTPSGAAPAVEISCGGSGAHTLVVSFGR